jgi:hypothetical protein
MLISCVECNSWTRIGGEQLVMELPEEDIEALATRCQASVMAVDLRIDA